MSLEAVDATVNQIIAEHFDVPVMLRALVKGNDHHAELDQVTLELRQLPARGLARAEEQAERERLWAEQDRIEALPVEEDRWEEVATGEFYADLYAAVPVPGRGAWLSRHGFRVTASRAEAAVEHALTGIGAVVPLT